MVFAATGSSAQDPMIGTLLGGCRIESILGRGGMGAVYKAHHMALDKSIALKLLAPFLAVDNEYVARFVREARAAARLEHPNIVQVLNVAQEKDKYFIIMQYVEGQTLDQVLKRESKLDLKRATRVARETAAGLAAAHKEGVIHRDIKPANILLSKDGVVKIADFGLARNVRQQSGLTMDGTFMGTPEYVSPEQADGRNVDHRTDLYSLGVVYYQMLSGKLPFEGRSAMDLAAKHLRDAPPPLPTVAPGIDPRAAVIVHRLLQKDPRSRFIDARELILELDRILSVAPSAAPTVPAMRVPPPTATPAPRPITNALTKSQVAERRARRRSRGLRNVCFWAILAAVFALFFSAGVLGVPRHGQDFWMDLIRPFTEVDDGLLVRVSLAALGGVGLIAALILNRKDLAVGAWPAAGVILFLSTCVCLYVAGVHAPASGQGVSAIERAARGALEAWPDSAQLAVLAVAAMSTALLLAGSRTPGIVHRALGAVLLLGALVAMVLFEALCDGGTPSGPIDRISREMGLAMAGLVGGVGAGLGVYLLYGRRHDSATKVLGVMLVLLSIAGLYVFALPGQNPTQALSTSLVKPLLGLPESLAAHEGALTLAGIFLVWGSWLFYSRSPLYRGYYSY